MLYRSFGLGIVAACLVAPSLASATPRLAPPGAAAPGSMSAPAWQRSRAARPDLRMAAKGAKGFSVAYTFSGFAPFGRGLDGGLAIDKKGDIFGTTSYGPYSVTEYGSLYELQPSASGYSYTTIAAFDTTNGTNPEDGPVLDAAGNLYVTTTGGTGSSAPYGTVNEYTQGASGWTPAAFTALGAGSDGGRYPYASPTVQNGTVYVPTTQGGTYSQGAIYALNPSTLAGSVVYSFKGPDRGDLEDPYGMLVPGPGGVLYGTGIGGGTGFGSQGGSGGVYTLSGGVYTMIFQFPTDKNGLFPGGAGSRTPVVVDKNGDIYGTTEYGGSYAAGTCQNFGCGVVFKLTKASGYSETVLHAFSAGSDGYQALQGLVLKGKTLYGTTYVGGTAGCGPGGYGCGTIFKIKTSGKGYKVLHRFVGSDGANPLYGSMTLVGKTLYGGTEDGYTGTLTNGGVIFTYTI